MEGIRPLKGPARIAASRLEVILYSAYYEGATVTVWHFGAGKLHKVLEIGCRA